MKNNRALALILPPLLVAHSAGLSAQDTPVFEEVLVTAEKRTESLDRKSTRLNSSHVRTSRMPSSA